MKTFDQEWDKVHQSKNWGKYPAEEVIRFVFRNFSASDRSEMKILDLGCGQGANCWFLARENFDFFAVDGSYRAATKCDELVRTITNPQGRILQADLGLLPFADSSFDAIVDAAAISANSKINIELILKEITRILKPGGKFLSTGLFDCQTSGYQTGQRLEENTYRNLTSGPLAQIGTIHFFTSSEIKHLWQKAGFNNIKIDSLTRTDNNEQAKVSYFIVEACS
ncbi:MAG: class I SAM-dependent methyltransferase [Candidatus Rifleibacteriota bacterium]